MRETSKSVAEVARDLGINAYTLHNRVKADRGLSGSEREELARLRVQKARWDKERAELLMERDVLKRSVILWVKDSMSVAEFVASQRTMFGIPHAITCRTLQVSQSWFHKWINRRPAAREQRREWLDAEIKRLFIASGGAYGSPRITRDLREAGWAVLVDTVAARTAEPGLRGRRPKRRRGLTRPGRRPAP